MFDPFPRQQIDVASCMPVGGVDSLAFFDDHDEANKSKLGIKTAAKEDQVRWAPACSIDPNTCSSPELAPITTPKS